MKTAGGFIAECPECKMTQEFKTRNQRQLWIFKKHIGHTVYLWRQPQNTAAQRP